MKILVYDDNLDFGGHQIMACRGIKALAETPELQISVIYHPQNKKLRHMLQQIESIEACPISENLIQQVTALSPDRVICIQGDIRQSTQGIDAARKLGIKCISYIAIAHPMSQTGAKLGTIRDRFSQRQINRADIYITISDSMKTMLLKRKTKAPIHVVHNGIPYPPIPKLKTSNTPKTIGVIGRIEFKQKQQDFMVRAFQEQPDMLKNCNLLFAGNGPDKKRLQSLIKDAPNMSLIPWTDDIESFYDQIDLLAMPSRYEGVPLVLLEALARGIPVMASATDGMQEILPKSWTFDYESTASMAWAFTEIQHSWQIKLEDLQQTIVTDYSIEAFNQNFVKAVIS